MHFLDLTLPEPAQNVALDEALLLEAEAGRLPPLLRIWEETRPVVVIGSGSRIEEEVAIEKCCADGVPILRRVSGGGAVLLGPGCLCYSVILPTDLPGCGDIRSSVSFVLTKTCEALHELGLAATVAGRSDVVIGSRKVSGNSQRRMLRFFLHHGTLLYDLDLSAMGKYLRNPKQQPDYRQGRGHAEFVANLPTSPEALKRMLRFVWNAHEPWEDWPGDETLRLVQTKYSLDSWTFRR
ncbi:MAG: lipoate--protein ligase family protein [Gemmatales bacterium]|nr:lipoate--protein ligase family protein [Gemmatales bacterium]MDW8386362.1 biotin/lipoate A/B protein ligase family protein [Gemmatales bacterium]